MTDCLHLYPYAYTRNLSYHFKNHFDKNRDVDHISTLARHSQEHHGINSIKKEDVLGSYYRAVLIDEPNNKNVTRQSIIKWAQPWYEKLMPEIQYPWRATIKTKKSRKDRPQDHLVRPISISSSDKKLVKLRNQDIDIAKDLGILQIRCLKCKSFSLKAVFKGQCIRSAITRMNKHFRIASTEVHRKHLIDNHNIGNNSEMAFDTLITDYFRISLLAGFDRKDMETEEKCIEAVKLWYDQLSPDLEHKAGWKSRIMIAFRKRNK